MKTPKEKILELMNAFGMKGVFVARVMGIKPNTFKKCMSEKATRNNFNEKNVQDLKYYIKAKAKEIE